ncbi:MAG TPA: carboxypeptidase regulatory-like domain-containing protein [Candidatus Acidoferrales bacterium]|nr:carboxypeptidase regulatory-like domain-containing protein [Candidatus Acidoferrales bacterium]
MKAPISKSALAIVVVGIIFIAGLIEMRLHPRKQSTPATPSDVVEKTAVPTTAPAPKPTPPKPAVSTGAVNTSLAVIPISLTNVIIESEINVDAAMKALPAGTQVYGGIEFWLQGAVQLQSQTTRDDQHKKFRTSIVVPLTETNFADGAPVVTERGKNIASLYLLAGTRFGSVTDGEKFADLVWHYADGTRQQSALEYDVHLRDWARKPYESPVQLPNALTRVAWQGPHPTRKDRTLRLYRVAFVNPHPEKIIASVEFASALARPSLFVCALTLDPLMPGARPDNLTSDEMADPELNGQLQLYVQDDAGHPLPNAQVSAISHSPPAGSVTQKFTTDNNGSALVKFPDTGLETLEVSAVHDDFSGRKMLWDLKTGDTVPASYTLKLSGEVKIGGLVVDEQEAPIPGVSINLYRFWTGEDGNPNRKGEQANFPNMNVSTDGTGRWEAKGLPSNLLDHISVEAKHPDYVGQQINAGSASEKALRTETYKMILKRGLEVTGRVLDDSGNPVSGATVFAGGRYYSERQQMNTGDDGQFHFNKMTEGTMEFSVTAKGRLPGVKSVSVKPGMDEIVFRLGPGKVIQGTVQNAAGEPLAGTRIDLEDANGGVAQSYEFYATTGSDGRFTWDGAPDEPVHFYFYHAGYEQKRGVLLKTDSDNTVVLQKSRTVQGQVVDADTGNPITKFRVGVGRDPQNFGGTFNADYPGMKDYSDANGAFTLQLDEEYDTYIDAMADDYAESGQALPAAQNDTVQVTLKLKQSPALRGVVVSPAGQPLPGVSVALLKSSPHGGAGGLSLSGTKLRSYNQNSKVSVTDDEGKFVLPSPPEGATVLAVGEAGFANVPVDQVRQNSDVVLLPFGRIEGILKIGGQPGAGKDLMLMLGISGIGTDWDSYKQTTDDQGRFTMEHVPPGDVQISRVIATSPNSSMYSDATSVTVQPGETAQVTLGDKGAVLTGQIRYQVQPTNDTGANLEGRVSQPLPPHAKFNSPAEAQAYYSSPEWKALMKQQKNYTAEIHPDGSFEVDDVVPGTYSMNADARVGGQRPWEHQPFAQGSTTITVPDSFDPTTPIDIGEVVLQPVTSH